MDSPPARASIARWKVGRMSARRLLAVACLLLASCASPPDPAPASPPRAPLDVLNDQLRSTATFEADLTFEGQAGELLGELALAYEASGPTLVVTLRRPGEPAQVQVLTTRSMTGWGEGDAQGTRLVFELDRLMPSLHAAMCQMERALGKTLTYATLEAMTADLRPRLTIRPTREEEGRPSLTFALGVATGGHDVASWLEDARCGQRSEDGTFERADAHLRVALDPKSGFFASQEVTQPGGGRFVLRCRGFRAGAPFRAPTPPALQEPPIPAELLAGMVRDLFAPLAGALAEAARGPRPLAEVGEACRAQAAAETGAIELQAQRDLVRELVAGAPDRQALRDDLAQAEATFLARSAEARAALEELLARHAESLRQRTLEVVTDPTRRRELDAVLAVSLEPGALAALRAKSATPVRDLLREELARPR